jgi:rhamnogalacturonan endolyase
MAVNDSPIMDATYQMPDGSVYTKYDWANYIVEDSVHGIMSDNEGIWAIAASNEFMNGGPMKQELTVHTTNKTPLVLQMLQGEHFGAAAQYYESGDEKIYGPFFIYVNSGNNHDEMIEDAKAQASLQKTLWPYQWLANDLYPLERSTVTGKLNVSMGLSQDDIQVVLAGQDMDIYDQGKAYMFWSRTNSQGRFTIPDVRPGVYSLYAYATRGEITDVYKKNEIQVSGNETDIGTIDWTPTKYEYKLWQIGENDRLTKGFSISDSLRAYGLYNLPPANLTYNVESSTPESDWYYAQTKTGTWTIAFDCDQTYSGNALLTASIAGASNNPVVDVYINNVKETTWSFSNDGAVYRSAVLGGRHQVKTLSVPSSRLVNGSNSVGFKMTGVGSRGGLMYDCIKLEAGQVLTSIDDIDQASKSLMDIRQNPFTDHTTFAIDARVNEKINLSIFNLQGRLIGVVFDGWVNQGLNEIKLDGRSLPDGVYIYHLRTDHGFFSGKIEKVH